EAYEPPAPEPPTWPFRARPLAAGAGSPRSPPNDPAHERTRSDEPLPTLPPRASRPPDGAPSPGCCRAGSRAAPSHHEPHVSDYRRAHLLPPRRLQLRVRPQRLRDPLRRDPRADPGPTWADRDDRDPRQPHRRHGRGRHGLPLPRRRRCQARKQLPPIPSFHGYLRPHPTARLSPHRDPGEWGHTLQRRWYPG